MTNNAQLLPLPELSDDDLELLHYNPNTSDVVEFLHRYAQSYALACIEAAKPAETCNYPDCKCPFDAPADPNWCARGLPKKNNATQNATIQPAESIAAQGTSQNSATKNATLPATDALGSLPVVGYIEDGVFGYASYYTVEGIAPLPGSISLTDHALATYEAAQGTK